MRVHAEREDGILIATAVGRVDGANALEFQNALQAAIGDEDDVILDLAGLSYISSAGLRVFLLIAQQVKRRSGRFSVCSLSDSIEKVFTISGFDRVIPTHGSRSEACASYAG
ncbi:MAG: STAS domain-containing protein [Acidobacteriota bacterium]|nr:STAS domain-containing protein [Acidobacteriota bacterium]